MLVLTMLLSNLPQAVIVAQAEEVAEEIAMEAAQNIVEETVTELAEEIAEVKDDSAAVAPALVGNLSGTCGDKAEWSLDLTTGTLTISGEGEARGSSSNRGWEAYIQSINKIVVEDGITQLGYELFSGHTAVTSLTLPGSLRVIGHYAFDGCESLTGITVPSGVTEIGSAFQNCTGLKFIVIPATVTSIQQFAFEGCTSLKDIYYGSSKTAWSYLHCNAEEPSASANIHSSPVGFCGENLTWTFDKPTGTLTISGTGPMVERFADWICYTAPWYDYVDMIQSVVVEEGVTSITDYAFFADFPNKAYSNISSVTLPGTLEEIGDWAFACCSALKSITFDSNLKYIGYGAFYGCSGLSQMQFLGNAPTIGEKAFGDIRATIYYPGGNNTWTSVAGKNYGANSLAWKVLSLTAPKISVDNRASDGKPVIKWSAVGGAREYRVCRATSKNGTYNLVNTVSGTSYTDTAATVAKTYYYKVKTVLINDEVSGYSNTVSSTCDLPQPKVKASNVSSSGKIKLSWNVIKDVEEYRVYYATSKNGEYTLLKKTTGIEYTHSSAKVGKTYYYKVRAIYEDSAANSAYSEIVSCGCDLARPSVKTANTASSGKVKLTWKAISGAESYTVYRATSKSGTYSKLKTTENTYYTDSSATVGKTYYYKVQANYKTGTYNSAQSSAVSDSRNLARPDVKVKLKSNGDPNLSWEKITGASKYYVYRATSKDGDYSKIATVSKSASSYTDKKAKAGKTYYYKVKAVKSGANSAYSSVDKIKAR